MIFLNEVKAESDYGNNQNSNNMHKPVIFISVGYQGIQKDSELKVNKALNEHREYVASSLKNMDRAYRVANESERFLFGSENNGPLTSSLLNRIEKIAMLLEADCIHLENYLLRPIRTVLALPEPAVTELSTVHDQAIYVDSVGIASSYDSVVHVISHVVRDWTSAGNQAPYQWCVHELSLLYPLSSKERVLVPGAGLGRLAWEISNSGFIVDANECSLIMSTAAYNIFNQQASGVVHPFCYDSMANEINPTKRYDGINYPGIEINLSNQQQGKLSYTIGDFVGAYLIPSKQSTFDVVVTCFFIDTATNFFEYLHVIKHVLRTGGHWVNYGPLQWHGNALITPSVFELKEIIQKSGFEILKWDVDQDLVNYRSNEDTYLRFTRSEGYHSLRFVVIYNDCCSSPGDDISTLRHSIRRATEHGKYVF